MNYAVKAADIMSSLWMKVLIYWIDYKFCHLDTHRNNKKLYSSMIKYQMSYDGT